MWIQFLSEISELMTRICINESHLFRPKMYGKVNIEQWGRLQRKQFCRKIMCNTDYFLNLRYNIIFVKTLALRICMDILFNILHIPKELTNSRFEAFCNRGFPFRFKTCTSIGTGYGWVYRTPRISL